MEHCHQQKNGTTINEGTREVMTSYWQGFSGNTSMENMMLDSNAAALSALEVPEIMSMLPPPRYSSVLELASGIGRYTKHFAPISDNVLAVEFIPEYHHANVELHSGFENNHMKFLCQDVTKLDLEGQDGEFDLIFINWLLMYLSDTEIRTLATKMLKSTQADGHVFFRESCYGQSGNAKRCSGNPTQYRDPSFYINMFRSISLSEVDPSTGQTIISSFELVSTKTVQVYRKMKNNRGQMCFLWKKVSHVLASSEASMLLELSFQMFLDEQQYSSQSISRYEKIFGKGYLAPGGQDTTTEFVEKLNLKQSDRVLDVGCGIGGGNFYMAREFGASVVGIDLSTNVILKAFENSMKPENEKLDVEFEVCDATTKQYDDASFDVVYSRDTILHIEDKLALFQHFFKWLKPGGKLMISDYCCGSHTFSDRFQTYVDNRGYYLLSPADYGIVLENAGFVDVVVEDRTEQFIEILNSEVSRTMENKNEFVMETSMEDFDSIIDGWKAKIDRCEDGDQKWGFFMATKPL